MGGLGSGRWPGYISGDPTKETTEDYFGLDIRAVKRYGLIERGQEELPGIGRIVWTSSGFGAPEGSHLRPWFICPLEDCQRRVAILYAPDPQTPKWACRTCRDLCYPVENQNQMGRAIFRERKIRWKLGPGGTRPKGMHQTTYARLLRQHLGIRAHAEDVGRERVARQFDQMQKENVRWDREISKLSKK